MGQWKVEVDATVEIVRTRTDFSGIRRSRRRDAQGTVAAVAGRGSIPEKAAADEPRLQGETCAFPDHYP